MFALNRKSSVQKSATILILDVVCHRQQTKKTPYNIGFQRP